MSKPCPAQVRHPPCRCLEPVASRWERKSWFQCPGGETPSPSAPCASAGDGQRATVTSLRFLPVTSTELPLWVVCEYLAVFSLKRQGNNGRRRIYIIRASSISFSSSAFVLVAFSPSGELGSPVCLSLSCIPSTGAAPCTAQ